MYHPDVTLSHARDRQRDLIAQANRHRLVSALRRRTKPAASAPRVG